MRKAWILFLILASVAWGVELDEATPLQLVGEMTRRGFTRWGCDDQGTAEVVFLRPPMDGTFTIYHGQLLIDFTIYASADTISWTWPVGSFSDSATVRIRAADTHTVFGPWSDWQATIPLRGDLE